MKTSDWLHILVIQSVILMGGLLLIMFWYFASLLRQTLIVLLFASVLAMILHPAVQFLQRWGLPRWLAAVLIYLVTVFLFVFASLYLYQPTLDQLDALIKRLPHYAEVANEQFLLLEERLAWYGITFHLPTLGDQYLNQLASGGGLTIVSNTVGLLSRLGATITNFILVIVISIYLLIDAPRMARISEHLMPAQSSFVLDVASTTNRIFGRYIRGQLILSIIIGISVWIGLTLLGMPYAVLLALAAGILELVPMFGAVLGAIPALVIAAFMPWPKLLIVALFFIFIHQVEGNILAPRITGQAVGLRPAATIIAFLAGFELGGLWGGIFFVPLIAIVYSMFMSRRKGLSSHTDNSEQKPPSPGLFSRLQRKGRKRPENEV